MTKPTTTKPVTNWVPRKVNFKLFSQLELPHKVAVEETLAELFRCLLVAVPEQEALRG